MKTAYAGAIVAYVELNAHQYATTITLDGERAWIDEGGQLHLNFGDEVVQPEKWNFVGLMKPKGYSPVKHYEHIITDAVYAREDLPKLEDNVRGEVA